MPRIISSQLNDLLNASEVKIEWTVAILFPDATIKRFATKPLTLTGTPAGTYSNDVESVGEIRSTLEAPADSVRVELQNKDRVLSIDATTNWQKWRNAEAVIGRFYYDPTGILPSTWVEMFSGSVQKTTSDDFKLIFDVVDDTLTPGEIVCKRNLAPRCPAVFKHLKTCGYTGAATTCNHILKSSGGCDGLGNSHHFMGMEHRYSPDLNVPGSGGNPDTPPFPIGGGNCPRHDQFTLARGLDGEIVPRLVGLLCARDWLWHPILEKFVKIRGIWLIPDQPVSRVTCENGAAGVSSTSHPLIQSIDDVVGTPVQRISVGDSLMTYRIPNAVNERRCVNTEKAGVGDVVRIELDTDIPAEKIYCYSDSPTGEFFICHNSKELEL